MTKTEIIAQINAIPQRQLIAAVTAIENSNLWNDLNKNRAFAVWNKVGGLVESVEIHFLTHALKADIQDCYYAILDQIAAHDGNLETVHSIDPGYTPEWWPGSKQTADEDPEQTEETEPSKPEPKMMTRVEMETACGVLISCHRSSNTPAETVQSLVDSLGYETAREIVALCVIARGEWDQRIGEDSRAWAFDLTGTTYDTLRARYFYYPDAIHPAHMEQIARVMATYQPEPEEAETLTVTNPETGDTITREFTASQLREVARDGYAVTSEPELEEVEESTPTADPAAPQYTETRIMYGDQLRALCIRQDWYTRGTCSEYERLFDRLNDEHGNFRNLATADLAGIAQDIADHSVLADGWEVTDIMYELARVCTVTFGTVEAAPVESPSQCEDETEPTRKTRADRAAYALKMAHESADFAREDLKWARADRLAGDRLESCWGLKKAAHHRENAAEWFRRYRRAAARRFRDTETGQTLTESELLEIYQNDKELQAEYPSAGAYVNACQTYQGGTLEEIK